MTNYIVNSPQTLLTGTTTNDLFQLDTALAVSVFGIEGGDLLTGNATNYNQAIINGGAGNDTITFAATGSATRASLIGGGGDDVFSGGFASTAASFLLQGGGGNDTITISGGSGGTAATVNGNGGNDVIGFSASAFTNSLFAAGGGNDTISGSFIGFNSSTMIGGGGNDVITGTISAGGTAAVIAGDTNSVQSEFDGNDTIALISATSIAVGLIQGGGGNDDITIEGLGSATTVGGNAGNDSIYLSAISGAVRAVVNAGGGDDVISGNFGGNQDMTVHGGGGNDTITLSATNAAMSAITSYTFGGDGADIFTLQAGAGFSTSTTLNSVAYSNAGESNISAFDTVSGNGNGFSVAEFYLAAATAVDTAQGTTITATNGRVTFNNTFALGVTARAAAIDALSPTKGGTYFFNDGLGGSFLFVQGGSAGTSDDLLVKAGSGQVITAITVGGIGAGLPGSRIGVTI